MTNETQKEILPTAIILIYDHPTEELGYLVELELASHEGNRLSTSAELVAGALTHASRDPKMMSVITQNFIDYAEATFAADEEE